MHTQPLTHKGKLNQKATMLLLTKLEELREVGMAELKAGEYQTVSGPFLLAWGVADHTPYFGTKQIRCRVIYQPAATVVVESLFYRSE